MSISKTLPNSIINRIKMINTAVIVILFAMSLSNFCPSKEEKLYKLHDPFIPGFFVYVLIIDIIMYTFRTLC